MTAKPIARARAIAAKKRAIAELDELRTMNNSYLMILGVLLDHVVGKCVTIDVAVLEAFDARRVAIADASQKHGKVVIGLKETAESPIELEAFKKRALRLVEAPPAEEPASTDTAQQLLDLLEHISDEYYSAGWVDHIDNGTLFRRAFGLSEPNDFTWQQSERCQAWNAQMRDLAEKSGVWWVWDDGEPVKTIALIEAWARWAPPTPDEDDRPVAQLVEQEPLTLPVGGSNPSGLAEESA